MLPVFSSNSFSSSSSDVDRSVIPTVAEKGSRKRFLTSVKFAKLADVKLRRKIAPIKKWRELDEHVPYRVVATHSMEVSVKGNGKETATYAELRNKEGQMINVWMTEIIQNELEKHDFVEGNVYIMPLGKTTSKETGRDYFDFAVVEDN